LAIEARHRLDQQVATAVPNYQEVDRDPRWHRWLMGVDALSGQPRQQLLNDAIASGSVSRIAAFFRGFQQGERAGGTQALGRARAAVSSDKPIYSRAQIGALYEAHRKGALVGAAWEARERDIFDAQREGRVVDVPYLTK
jgi:hypothetical protein